MSGLVGRAGALLVLGGLHVYWFAHPAPWWIRLVHLAFLALACWSPRVGLVVLAGLGPIAATLTAVLQSPFASTRHIELLVLSVVTGVVLHWRAGTPTRTGRPALVFGTLALASAAAAYPTLLLYMEPDAYYFVRNPLWDPLFFGMLAAEGAALVWAVESLGRRSPELLPRVVIATLLGHATAAALTLRELFEPASQSPDAVLTFLSLFANFRVHSQYDVNAAASALVLVTLASVGVMDRFRSIVLAPAMLLVLAGLWQTGSRVALAALGVAALAAICVTLFQATRRQRWLGVTAIVGLVAVAVTLFLFYPGRRNISLDTSIKSRRVLTATGLRMVADEPATGIGVGRFHALSPQYGSADISGILGVARTHDNAHNNFVQVLAELGIVGLLAFVWLLWAVLGRALAGWRARPPTERWFPLWVTAGVAGTMLTWLTGHPLLVPESAGVFWMCAGLVATSGPVRTPGAISAWMTGLLIVAIVASIPFQSEGHRDRALLEHQGRGLSQWQPEVDGHRYRVGDTQSVLFVPTGAMVTVPVRLAESSDSPVEVGVWVDGGLANRVALTSATWTDLRIRIIPTRRRFVELRIEGPASIRFWFGRVDAQPLP